MLLCGCVHICDTLLHERPHQRKLRVTPHPSFQGPCAEAQLIDQTSLQGAIACTGVEAEGKYECDDEDDKGSRGEEYGGADLVACCWDFPHWTEGRRLGVVGIGKFPVLLLLLFLFLLLFLSCSCFVFLFLLSFGTGCLAI